MKIKYFEDTDTLYIELRPDGIVESQLLDDDTTLDLDTSGGVCAVTVEHASRKDGSAKAGYRWFFSLGIGRA